MGGLWESLKSFKAQKPLWGDMSAIPVLLPAQFMQGVTLIKIVRDVRISEIISIIHIFFMI